MFDITRGTRQGSKLSPYLFNIFINQLLLDLHDCDVGVRIGDALYNSMAYADDITVFSTNAKDLQRRIDMCTMYSDRWRFKYGIDKSKCMAVYTLTILPDARTVRERFAAGCPCTHCVHCVGFVRYTETTSGGVRSGRERFAKIFFPKNSDRVII